jgi:hypothetical protein
MPEKTACDRMTTGAEKGCPAVLEISSPVYVRKANVFCRRKASTPVRTENCPVFQPMPRILTDQSA